MATQVSTASKGYMQIHVNVGIYIARMSLAYSQITCFSRRQNIQLSSRLREAFASLREAFARLTGGQVHTQFHRGTPWEFHQIIQARNVYIYKLHIVIYIIPMKSTYVKRTLPVERAENIARNQKYQPLAQKTLSRQT